MYGAVFECYVFPVYGRHASQCIGILYWLRMYRLYHSFSFLAGSLHAFSWFKKLLSDYPNNCQQVISSFKWVFHRSMINGKQICIIVVDLQITNVELRPNENKLCHPSRSHRLSFSPGNRYKIPQIYNSNLFLASRTCFYEIM